MLDSITNTRTAIRINCVLVWKELLGQKGLLISYFCQILFFNSVSNTFLSTLIGGKNTRHHPDQFKILLSTKHSRALSVLFWALEIIAINFFIGYSLWLAHCVCPTTFTRPINNNSLNLNFLKSKSTNYSNKYPRNRWARHSNFHFSVINSRERSITHLSKRF